MKKFQFRLESILELRKSREKDGLKLIAAKQRELKNLQINQEQLLLELDEVKTKKNSSQEGVISIADFTQVELFIEGINQKIEMNLNQMAQKKKQIQKFTIAYLKMKQEADSLQLLKDKRFSEFKKNLKKQEQKDMQELVTIRSRLKVDLW